jgi:hypothetical protein
MGETLLENRRVMIRNTCVSLSYQYRESSLEVLRFPKLGLDVETPRAIQLGNFQMLESLFDNLDDSSRSYFVETAILDCLTDLGIDVEACAANQIANYEMPKSRIRASELCLSEKLSKVGH